MKRAGIFAAIATLLFFLVAGAYSKQEAQAKEQEQAQMEKIGRELSQLTHQAHRLAEQIQEAKIILAKGDKNF